MAAAAANFGARTAAPPPPAAAAPAPGAAGEAVPFAEAFARDVRPLLDAVDRVRPYLAGENIELPAIVVVVSQAAAPAAQR